MRYNLLFATLIAVASANIDPKIKCENSTSPGPKYPPAPPPYSPPPYSPPPSTPSPYSPPPSTPPPDSPPPSTPPPDSPPPSTPPPSTPPPSTPPPSIPPPPDSPPPPPLTVTPPANCTSNHTSPTPSPPPPNSPPPPSTPPPSTPPPSIPPPPDSPPPPPPTVTPPANCTSNHTSPTPSPPPSNSPPPPESPPPKTPPPPPPVGPAPNCTYGSNCLPHKPHHHKHHGHGHGHGHACSPDYFKNYKNHGESGGGSYSLSSITSWNILKKVSCGDQSGLSIENNYDVPVIVKISTKTEAKTCIIAGGYSFEKEFRSKTIISADISVLNPFEFDFYSFKGIYYNGTEWDFRKMSHNDKKKIKNSDCAKYHLPPKGGCKAEWAKCADEKKKKMLHYCKGNGDVRVWFVDKHRKCVVHA